MKLREFVASKGYDVAIWCASIEACYPKSYRGRTERLILSGEIKAGDTIKVSKEKDSEKLKFDIVSAE